MKLTDIVNNINVKKVIGSLEKEFKNFSKDTRTIQKGDIYLGIKGENFDGNSFYKDALEKSASACILDNESVIDQDYVNNTNATIIIVEDTVKALQEYASYKRSTIKVPVIAITGSAGKTSTKDMLASVLSTKYKTFKSKQNFNNEIGCPLMITEYQDEEVVVLEMGTSALGEISVLSNIARPNIAIVTNVGTAHIGILGSRENILKAKMEILEGMEEDGTLIINNDNDLLHKYYEENKNTRKIVTFGIENESDIMPSNIEYGETSSTFSYDGTVINVPFAGTHFIYNTLASIAVCKILGISVENVNEGLKNVDMSKNRMEIIKKDNVTIINDAYNANAEAMKYAIKNLSMYDGRKIAVLGSMLELGDYTKELHEGVAASLIDNKIDVVISIGKEMEYLYDYLKNNGYKENYHFESLEEIVEFLKQNKKENDTILIKGSNGMKLFNIVNEL